MPLGVIRFGGRPFMTTCGWSKPTKGALERRAVNAVGLKRENSGCAVIVGGSALGHVWANGKNWRLNGRSVRERLRATRTSKSKCAIGPFVRPVDALLR